MATDDEKAAREVSALRVTRRMVAKRLLRRLVRYSGVGIGTYVLDIAIIALLAFGLGVPNGAAVGAGFLVGLSVNYHLSYHWVFKGTERNLFVGYAIFAVLAMTGLFVITQSVSFLVEEYNMHLLIARTIVAAFVGLFGFLINTFFNFKLV